MSSEMKVGRLLADNASEEPRQLMKWMQLFGLGAFVGLSAATSFLVGGNHPRIAAMLVAAGAVLAAISWRRLGPVLKVASETNAVLEAPGRAA